MSMMDGVTTGMDLELGALNIAAWYEREKGKWPMNYGQAVGHEYVRAMVHDGLKFDGPIDAVDVFNNRAAAVKDDGVRGLVGHEEQPGTNQPDYEDHGRRTCGRERWESAARPVMRVRESPPTNSSRFSGPRPDTNAGPGSIPAFTVRARRRTEAQLGFAEVFTNACLLKAPLLICHDNDYGWWEIEEKLQMARAMGMNMWAEYYPYASGSSAISADGYKPESVEGNLGLKYEDMMFDPIQNKYLTKEDTSRSSRRIRGAR